MLLVNDEPFLIMSYSNQFQFRFDVEVAENGYQALQIVTSNETDYFDVIILDINMPIMNGLEAIDRIRDYYHVKDESYGSN